MSVGSRWRASQSSYAIDLYIYDTIQQPVIEFKLSIRFDTLSRDNPIGAVVG
jgi:hypothetical protein